MTTVTIPKKEYQSIIIRQKKIEAELNLVKRILHSEITDGNIQPFVLKRWEGISGRLDSGNGRSFTSLTEMKRWFKNL